MTDPDAIVKLAVGHDAVAPVSGPGESSDIDVQTSLTKSLIEGLRPNVNRLRWVGGASSLAIGPTTLIETDEVLDDLERSSLDRQPSSNPGAHG